MPSITPCLWFDNALEEAAQYYTSVFPNSSIENFDRYTEAGPGTPAVFPDAALPAPTASSLPMVPHAAR